MHVFIGFVDLRSVSLRSESSQTFLENVETHWLVTGDQNINSQIELVSVDEQGISNIPRDDRQLVNINIVDVINELDSSSLSGIGRLNDPNVLL